MTMVVSTTLPTLWPISSFSIQLNRRMLYSRGFLLILIVLVLPLTTNLSEAVISNTNNGYRNRDDSKTVNYEFQSSLIINSDSTNPSGRDDDTLFFEKTRQLRESVGELFHGIVRKRRELPSRKDANKEGFTEIEKDAMLLLHNSLRSQVTPTAANMIELTWDNDIEAFAQDWANKCTGSHNRNRNLNEWVNMGENLYWRGGGSFNEKLATDHWWSSEVVHYTFHSNKCVSGKVCGHYITAAWAKSAKIGCGIKRCATLPEAGINRKTYYFVCNYNARFLSNTRPYKQGTPCSNCPTKFPKCRYNLCVSQSMLDNCEGYNGTTAWIGSNRSTTVTDPSMDCAGFLTASTSTDQSTKGDNSAQIMTISLLLMLLSVLIAIKLQ